MNSHLSFSYVATINQLYRVQSSTFQLCRNYLSTLQRLVIYPSVMLQLSINSIEFIHLPFSYVATIYQLYTVQSSTFQLCHNFLSTLQSLVIYPSVMPQLFINSMEFNHLPFSFVATIYQLYRVQSSTLLCRNYLSTLQRLVIYLSVMSQLSISSKEL